MSGHTRKVSRTCTFCGVSFLMRADNPGLFCSRSCRGKSQRPLGLTHGMSKTPTYTSWMLMRARCYYPGSPGFPGYGGSGITVCDRWRDSFDAFLADMGERPSGTTLDRIDNSKGYEPGNCRWATPAQQSANRSATKLCPIVRSQAVFLVLEAGLSCRSVGSAFGVYGTTIGEHVKRVRSSPALMDAWSRGEAA